MFNIVLLEPENPDNVGNIGRTCVVANAKLCLIDPLGFNINKKNMKHAGLDYWERLKVERYINYIDFLYRNDLLKNVNIESEILKKYEFIFDNKKYEDVLNETIKNNNKLYFATTKAHKLYSDVKFNDGDFIMFGKESAGINEEILCKNEDLCIRIPMMENERSLNLSNSVAIVLYEALRQNEFLNLSKKGELHRLTYVK